MKIFILSNDYLGYKISAYLIKKEKIVGIGVNDKKSYYSKKLLNIFTKKFIFTIKKNISLKQINLIKKLKPDVILVVYWKYLLKESFFKIPKYGCINFHMAYLPYNRGKNPNFWSIVENTPAGCTIHKIDEGIDSGEILCQSKTRFNYFDTGKTLFIKILRDFLKLFYKNWNKMKENKFTGYRQSLKRGSFHLSKDFEKSSIINLKKKYYPLDLINIIRAKMFKPHKPAYFKIGNKKYYIEVKITK